jgi:MauM/NapG family ferredoxin protein
MKAKKVRLLQRSRFITQVFFSGLFFFLLLKTARADVSWLSQSGFFYYLDPLILWISLISGRLLAVFLLSLLPLLLTLVLGRFFCGWVCPFGAMNQFFTWISDRHKRKKIPVRANSLRIKYLLLIGLLVASLFATQWLGWLDPFSLLTRGSSVALFPGLNFIGQHALEIGADDRGLVAKIVKPFYDFSRRYLLTVKQRTFSQAVPIGLIFFVIILANFYRRRFFCNYVCPLGALYGFLARHSLLHLRLNQNCTQCEACSAHCTYYGSPFKDYLKSECTVCLNCLADCPFAAIDPKFSFPPLVKDAGVAVGRRKILAALGSGLALATMPQISLSKKMKVHPFIRPPGALREKDFLKKCVRCGQCLQVCPTNVIQPAVLQTGLEGLWTPLIVPLNGYCEYECHKCTQVCPTQAIARLTLEEKKQFKIGTAVINRSTCYTYADGYNCAVCEEHCPVPDKAIKFRDVEVNNFKGKLKRVKQIYVLPDLCIGCGICENVCPRIDAPAIFVSAEDEQREIENAP